MSIIENAHDSLMGRRSSVDALPQDVRDWIMRLREQGASYDDIVAKLRELDGLAVPVPSRSALHRAVQEAERLREIAKRQHIIAEAMVKNLGEVDDSKIARGNVAMAHAILTRMTPAVPLYSYQRKWLKDKRRLKAGMFARQSGKTFTTTLEIVDECMEFAVQRRRTKWIVLSRGERQSREAMDEGIKRHAAAYQLGFEAHEYDWEGNEGSHKALEVAFPHGSRVIALPANPDTARGFSANVFLDEFAIHKDSRAIWGALFPIVSKGGLKLRVTSTPKGKNNKFYEIMSAADDVWSRHAVDIYQAVADGLPRDIAELRAGLTDDDLWQQEYELKWLDEASAWLSYDLIHAVENEAAGDPDRYQGGVCFVGRDIGRRNDLHVIWVWELVGDVLWCREIIAQKRATFAEMDDAFDDVMERYRVGRACIDQTGMGEKVVEDAQRRWGSRVEGVLFTGPNKLILATAGKERFERRTVRIPEGDIALRSDPHKLRKVASATGAPRFIADRDEDHADRTWAAFLGIHAASDMAEPAGTTIAGKPLIRPPAGFGGGRLIADRPMHLFRGR